MKTAIIYTTKYGTTAKVAATMAEKLGEAHEVTILPLKQHAKPDISGYETVILGSSVYMGKASGKMKAFCNENESVLLQKKIGLFVCSMHPEKEQQYKELKEAYPELLQHNAVATGFFGGAFIFEQMNIIERAIIKKITNITTSTEKINWEAVEAFIGKIEHIQA